MEPAFHRSRIGLGLTRHARAFMDQYVAATRVGQRSVGGVGFGRHTMERDELGVRDLNVGPVIPVSNLEASREFYESKLGLRGESAPGGWALQAGGDTRIFSSTARTTPVAQSGR